MIKALASGSTGNAYLLGRILIECGIPYPKILKLGGWITPKACIITHSHNDHAKSTKDVAKHGIPIYASAGTLDEIDPKGKLRRAYVMSPETPYQILDWTVTPYTSKHCFGAFYYILEKDNEKLIFSTDNAQIEEDHADLTEIYIEANYSEEDLKKNEYLRDSKRVEAIRVHMSLEDCLEFLNRQDLSTVRKIILIHLSAENSDPADYVNRIQSATGVPTYIATEEIDR